jgi:hypothetical protein
MIGADSRLTPGGSASRKNPYSALAGMAPPMKIQDGVTEAAANNAMAQGIQKGTVRAGHGLNYQQGLSVNAMDRTKVAMQAASGAAEGAQNAANIRGEDQFKNSQLGSQWAQLTEGRQNANYDQMTSANSINFSRNFGQQQNRQSQMMARQQAMQNLRLALMQQMG